MEGVTRSAQDVTWFSEEQLRALDDYWSVYEADFERVHAGLRQWMQQRREYAPLLSSWPAQPFLEGGAPLKETLRRAMLGDTASYRARLHQLGAACADAELSLWASCEVAQFASRLLTPRLVELFARDPARLAAAVGAMSEFTAHSVASIAEAYLAHTKSRIQAREEDLATTLDSIGDGVIVTDADARVVRMNPVAQRLTGFSLDEALGKQLDEVFRIENEETKQTVESPVPRVLREGMVVGLANHTELIARDGTRRPIADSGAPVRGEDGRTRGVVLVFRDVTEERRAEEALRHWERIFQHANWGVALAGTDDIKFRAVNPEYARMHGYTVQELVGAPVSTLWTSETRADMERHAAETREHGHLVVETTHRRKDGSTLPVEIVATTIKDAQGHVAWFVANVQDISERKRLQQLRVHAIELEARNRRIEEANRLKSEFLASMSHELRTPLNSIIGFSELLHDEQLGAVPSQQKELLDDILSAGRHLLRLINDVLDLAKVEAGKMEFRPEPTVLAPLVQAVVQGLQSTAFEKRLQVVIEVDPALDDVVLDPVRFKQVLYNFVSNALKFTPAGGHVWVRVKAENGERVRLEVEDTGVGVPAKDAHRLFVEFQQLDSGAGKRHAGTGLGLALTKRLVEAQGGSVGMVPAHERGSIFFAILPRRPAGYTDSLLRPKYESRRSAILVVDDDAEDRAVIVRALLSAGYAVDAVSSCAEASQAWRRHSYHAVMLDLLLPDREHLHDLLEQVRGDTVRGSTPVIAMTMVSEHSAVVGFAVDDVLAKPLNAQGLLGALERTGVPPVRGRPVLVVDDDAGSLKLMQASLGSLGYDALCCADAREALRAAAQLKPAAVILDLVMPYMDGFAFLEQFRAASENDGIPVMIWTIKELSARERRDLELAASAVVQKGVDDGVRLSTALQALLSSSQKPTEAEEP